MRAEFNRSQLQKRVKSGHWRETAIWKISPDNVAVHSGLSFLGLQSKLRDTSGAGSNEERLVTRKTLLNPLGFTIGGIGLLNSIVFSQSS